MTKTIDRFIRGMTDAGKPRGAPHMFPYLGHRSMGEIMQQEEVNERNLALGRKMWKDRKHG